MLSSCVPFKYRKWLTLVGGFFIHLSLGSSYTFGNMSPYITSYLRVYSDPGSNYSKTAFIFSALSIAISLASILIGLVRNKFGFSLKMTTLLGCVLMW
jgi:hypothetical protein